MRAAVLQGTKAQAQCFGQKGICCSDMQAKHMLKRSST